MKRSLCLAVGVLWILLTAGSTGTAHAADWYVEASAKSDGNGSKANPFDKLADAELASGVGDTIYIRQSPANEVLDGQIVLKPDQKLIGLGPDVTKVSEDAAGARITYSGGGGTGFPAGAIVQLSSGNEIGNIHFKDMSFDAIVALGVDFSGANIHDNLFTHGDAFDFSSIRTAVWLISFVGHSDVIVRDNVVRDGESLWGVDVLLLGDSSATFLFEGNQFESIGFPAYSLVTGDTSYLQAEILNSSANNIGDLGEFSHLANSDSIAINLVGSSKQDVVVDGYTYDNTDQVGNFSNSGLELFLRGPLSGPPPSWGVGAEANLMITNSSFSNAVSEAIGCLNGGLNTVMNVEITNTMIFDANPQTLEVLRGVAGGAISFMIEDTGNTGSQGSLLIENSDIVGSTAYAVGVYDLGTTGFSTTFDMGGGDLGGTGNNRILDNAVGEVVLHQVNGVGKFNWWGENPPRVDLFTGSTFDYDPVLVADPLE